jgi:hypothetical protein
VRGMTGHTPCATIGSPMVRSAKPELSSPVEPSIAHYKRSRSSLGFPSLQNAGRTPRHTAECANTAGLLANRLPSTTAEWCIR